MTSTSGLAATARDSHLDNGGVEHGPLRLKVPYRPRNMIKALSKSTDEQVLAIGPQPQAWLQGGAPVTLRAGYAASLLGELAQPVHMCFVDMEKAYDWVPGSILWGVLQEYGVEGPLIRAVQSLYQRSRSLVRIASFLLTPSNRDLQQMLGQFVTECEAAGMRISTSKSESMVLAQKKVECLLRVGEEVLPQVEEFKYLGILFTSE
ncbi:hypothetical protein D4764_04G0013200, partial [Takifugu flavidus]